MDIVKHLSYEQQQQQLFYGPLSGSTSLSQYQKKTFTHSYLSLSSTILYELPPSTTINSILPVQFTFLQFSAYFAYYNGSYNAFAAGVWKLWRAARY